MRRTTIAVSRASIAATLGVTMATVWPAQAGRDLVAFPERYAEGVHYATVERGNIREEIFTSRDAIDAVKRGQSLPSGTVITLVDYRDGKLHRYVVMEKRAGWGADEPPELRNGEWAYQAFNADRSVNRNDDPARCMACHKARAEQDYVQRLDLIRDAK